VKKVIASMLAVILMLSLCVSPALAGAGDKRITIGANLTDEQKAQIYKDFGVDEGNVKEIKVTNEEERKYLEGLVPESKIGSRAISCTYITILEEGKGLSVATKNINWCTGEMYMNALITAGITDAKVEVSAPFKVSGTAALTGIYKAYEDIKGTPLDELAKQVGAEELVVTGELAEYLGSTNAAEIVAQLKTILDQTKGMSDEQVLAEIRQIAIDMNVELTDGQAKQLLSLCRSLEGLNVEELESRVNAIAGTIEKASKAKDFFTNLGKSVGDFFKDVGGFFAGLFGGK